MSLQEFLSTPIVVAAIITASAGVAGYFLSKGHKVSEFRQDWINALRDDLGILISRSAALISLNAAGFESGLEHWKVGREEFVEIGSASARIRLRLNHAEDSAVELLKCIDRLERRVPQGGDQGAESFIAIEAALIAAANVVLKEEWNRVKLGEFRYQSKKLCNKLWRKVGWSTWWPIVFCVMIFAAVTATAHAAFVAAARIGPPMLALLGVSGAA